MRNLAYRVQEAHGVLVECIGDEITDARIRQWQCTGVKLEEAARETGIQNENSLDSRFSINTKPLLALLPPDPNRMTLIISIRSGLKNYSFRLSAFSDSPVDGSSK